jgi:glycosyltransferase involved in cell wall biosynthesis
MARIALDARPLEKTYRTGVENVGAQFARLILQVPNRHAWYFYFTDPPKQKLPPSIRWRFYRGPAWLRLVVPLWLLADRVELVHFYLGYVPPLLRFLRFLRFLKTQTVVTVCDIMWLDDLSLIDPPSRKFIVKGVLPSLKFRTDHFIAISEATRKDLVTKLGIKPERISVVLPYVEEQMKPYPNASEAAKQLYGLDGPFLLFVGTAKPNKNIGRLLDAFAQLRARCPNAQLVIVGFVLPFWDETKRILRGEPGVRWLQYVPDKHLPILYSACTAFVSPALNEGFGLPLLEAMACGAPVLAGNTGAQPEIVGDAGILVNPYRKEAIAEAMEVVWDDETLRARLRQHSFERARLFTPRQSLEQLLSAYERALSYADSHQQTKSVSPREGREGGDERENGCRLASERGEINARLQPRYSLAFSARGQKDGGRLLAPNLDTLPLPSPFAPSDDRPSPFALGVGNGAISRH